MRLNLPQRTKRRPPNSVKQPLDVAPEPNRMWSMDFTSESLISGLPFRTLNVMDEDTREALAIEVDTSLPAERVIRVLEQIKDSRLLPKMAARL